MSRWLPTLMVSLGLAWLTACAAPAAPTGSGSQPASPAAPVAASQDPSEWDRVLAAAKQEGKVAVAGPAGADAREVLTEPFQEQYGISVEYFGASNRDLVPRLRTEREAGQFLWDVRVGGAVNDGLKPLGILEPIEPALLLPEVKDPSKWRGGQYEFSEPDRLIFVMSPFQRGTVFINTSQVRPDELKSYKDLLDPKWKGRLVMDDPRSTGPAEATFTFFLLHPELGPEFIRALGRQEPVIMKDYQQEVDTIGQGRFPILIGTADFIAEARMKQGIPIAIVDPRQLREGSDVSPANGEVALISRAPHPNAAKVYVNWLLSSQGQSGFVRGLGYVSNRLDVSADHVPAWRIPQPNAIRAYTEDVLTVKREQLMPLLYEVFGR